MCVCVCVWGGGAICTRRAQGDAAIKARMEGLLLFLNECLKSSYIRVDASFATWLTVKEVAGFEALKQVRWGGGGLRFYNGNIAVAIF